jgi:ribonuclease HI
VNKVLEVKALSVIIVTDGSIQDNVTAWGDAIWREGNMVYQWSAGRHGKSSSFRSECEAVEDALTWLDINSLKEDNAVILTYSMSLVTKLQRNRRKGHWYPLVQRMKATLEVIYFPGHAGVRYNERADKLAGAAVAFGDRNRMASDICALIADTIKERERTEDQTLSMRRLLEKGVERGEGASVLLRGCQRRTATQLQMGVISHQTLKTLLEMLEGRGHVFLPEPLLF